MRWIALAWIGLLAGCVNESFDPCVNDSQCPVSAPFCDVALKACQRAPLADVPPAERQALETEGAP